MARPKSDQADEDLRGHLLADAVRLREQYGRDPGCWRELSKPVEQLRSGQSYVLRRNDLPADHCERWRSGGANDLLLVDADDVLHSVGDDRAVLAVGRRR